MPNQQELIASVKNITGLKKAQRKTEEYLSLINHNIITSTTDLHGTINDTSQAFCDISGYTKDELINTNHRILRHPDMPDEVYEQIWSTLSQDKVWNGEIKNLRKDGTSYWVHASIYPIYDTQNNKIGYTSIRQDISDKKHIEEISITDGLTNIFNRRHFDALFPKFLNSAKRKDDLVCFLMLDVDNFKLYNDTYGHQKGDDVLISIAKVMKETLKRSDDYAFRLGGEEFGILFKSDSKHDASLFAELLRKNIKNLNIQHASNEEVVTVSIGLVAQNAKEIENVDILYKNADKLLYLAKENGRNRVEVF